jgi:hypothetical protein
MTARFLYVYFMRDQPDRIGGVVPRHVDYWKNLELPGYIGGPFSDRSGGSISFEAESGVDAERVWRLATRSSPPG